MKRPNVLFIITDQQRADSLGSVNGWAQTANLDDLARNACVFTNCFTNSPVCIPARFSLMSGLYPHNHGVQTNLRVTYPPWLGTWVNVLREHGYRTSMFGKTHLHPKKQRLAAKVEHLNVLGFDDVEEVSGPRGLANSDEAITKLWAKNGVLQAYKDDVRDRFRTKPWAVRPSPVGLELYYDTFVARSAARYLKEYDRPNPWFCYVGFPGPHDPWDTPEPWSELYKPEHMPTPAPMPESLGNRPLGELDRRLGARPAIEGADIAALRASYAGEISLIDSLIGEIFDVIKSRGEWSDTIVVFTSDHGEMNGDAGLLYKEVLLDGAVCIPLIIRDPSTRSRRIEDPVELMDVGPTILELVGVESGGRYRMAMSLMHVMRGSEDSGPRADALCEYDGEVMLASRDWKIALTVHGDTYLLFDRSVDESKNFAGCEAMAHAQRSMELSIMRRLVAASTREPTFDSPRGQRMGVFRRFNHMRGEINADRLRQWATRHNRSHDPSGSRASTPVEH